VREAKKQNWSSNSRCEEKSGKEGKAGKINLRKVIVSRILREPKNPKGRIFSMTGNAYLKVMEPGTSGGFLHRYKTIRRVKDTGPPSSGKKMGSLSHRKNGEKTQSSRAQDKVEHAHKSS